MCGELRQRLDDILRTVVGDEEAFNRLAEAQRLAFICGTAASIRPRSDDPTRAVSRQRQRRHASHHSTRQQWLDSPPDRVIGSHAGVGG
jgi:hypothetical protein